MIFFFQVKVYTDLIDAKSSQKAEDNVSEKSDEEVAMPQGKMSKKKRNKLNKREAARVRDEQAQATAAKQQADAEREKAKAAGMLKQVQMTVGMLMILIGSLITAYQGIFSIHTVCH